MKKFIDLFVKTPEKIKREQTVMMLKQNNFYAPVDEVIAEYKWIIKNDPEDPDRKIYRDYLSKIVPMSIIDDLEV